MAKRSSIDDDDIAIESSENHKNGSYSDNDEEDVDNDSAAKMMEKRRSKDKKKKKRVRIMTASGQTDADRRVLRRKQRELQTDISLDAANASSRRGNSDNDSSDDEDEAPINNYNDKNTNSTNLLSWREKNNALWNDVRYTREAVLDSENMDLITTKAAREAEKIVQVPRYDAITLAQNLVKKGSIRSKGITQFNWQGLGFQVGVCFSSLPSNCSFFYGPLDSEYKPKERKKAERTKKSDEKKEEGEDDDEDVEPENQDQRGKKVGDGNELSAVEKHIKIINSTLISRTNQEMAKTKERVGQYMTQLTQEEGIHDERELDKKKRKFMRESGKVDAINCLFNPKSFTQTVENVFHFSFAVKSGMAEIKVRGTEEAEEFGLEPGPVVRARDLNSNESAGGGKSAVPKQAIVSLSMKDWRDMCAAFSVEESDVPHRETVKREQVEPSKKKARRSE